MDTYKEKNNTCNNMAKAGGHCTKKNKQETDKFHRPFPHVESEKAE